MTNEEYQRQAERSDPIGEVRRRQGIKDLNWPETERDLRGADVQEKASELISVMNGNGHQAFKPESLKA